MKNNLKTYEEDKISNCKKVTFKNCKILKNGYKFNFSECDNVLFEGNEIKIDGFEVSKVKKFNFVENICSFKNENEEAFSFKDSDEVCIERCEIKDSEIHRIIDIKNLLKFTFKENCIKDVYSISYYAFYFNTLSFIEVINNKFENISSRYKESFFDFNSCDKLKGLFAKNIYKNVEWNRIFKYPPSSVKVMDKVDK